MGYGVVLTLDEQASRRVEEIWKKMADLGINDTMSSNTLYPHITLAVYESVYPNNVKDIVSSLADETCALPITLSHIGMFPGSPGALFLSLLDCFELDGINKLYYERTENFNGSCDENYMPPKWVPHCTLATPISASEAARAITEIPELSTEWRPLAAKLDTIEFVEFYPVKVHLSEPLRGHDSSKPSGTQ